MENKKETNIAVEVEAVVFDSKTEEIIKVYPPKLGNSFTKQFIQMLFILTTSGSYWIRNINNVLSEVTRGANIFRLFDPWWPHPRGIVIGSSDTPVTMDDYALGNLITVGVDYSKPHSYFLDSPNPSTLRLSISRVFMNTGGSTINVREVGMYTYDQVGVNRFCIERTLYNVDIFVGAGVTITYRISIFV